MARPDREEVYSSAVTMPIMDIVMALRKTATTILITVALMAAKYWAKGSSK